MVVNVHFHNFSIRFTELLTFSTELSTNILNFINITFRIVVETPLIVMNNFYKILLITFKTTNP